MSPKKAVSQKVLTKLVIDRKRWLRGGQGMLLNTRGKMCCLGFMARACGYKPSQILRKLIPAYIGPWTEQSALPAWARRDASMAGTRLIDDLSEANDDKELTDRQREAKIKKLFAKKKITVVFK